MTQHAPFDQSIPVLTEVFQDASAPAPQAESAAPVFPVGELTASDWEDLERRLAERILQRLQGRADFVLEQRLRDSMAEVIQHAIVGLTDEIRGGLQQTLETIVARAVAQEIAHLQAIKR